MDRADVLSGGFRGLAAGRSQAVLAWLWLEVLTTEAMDIASSSS